MKSPEEKDDIELDETGQAWEDLIDEQEAENDKEPIERIDNNEEQIGIHETVALSTSAKANLLSKTGIDEGIKEEYENLCEKCEYKSDYIKDCKANLKILHDSKKIDKLAIVNKGITLNPKKIIRKMQLRAEMRMIKRKMAKLKREIKREKKQYKKLVQRRKQIRKYIKEEFAENKEDIKQISREQIKDRLEERREKLEKMGIIVKDATINTKEKVEELLNKAKEKVNPDRSDENEQR